MILKKTLLLFLSLVLAPPEGNAAPAFPSLDADGGAAYHGRRAAAEEAGRGWRDLAAAALWASSVNAGPGAEEKAAAYMERIAAAAAELAGAADLPPDPRGRGEFVLGFLHRRFLKSYSEYQTRVDEIFVSGRYNCVSSAALYMILGRSVGLKVQGVMTRDHAFVTVDAGTGSAGPGSGPEIIDVETTNPYGFDPGNRKEFHDAFGKTTGFAYVPAKNYRDRAVLSGPELASLILSNRAAVLERGSRFAEAVPLAINRAAFLNAAAGVNAAGASAAGEDRAFFEGPRRDVMSRIFNLGSYFIRTGKEDDALDWEEYASPRFADPERWQELVNAAANNKLVKLIRAKKTACARAALGVLRPRLNDANYRALDYLVLDAEAADRVNGIKNPGDAEAALAFLASGGSRLSAARLEELRTAAVLAEADRYGRVRDWTGGMAWLASALERYENSGQQSARRIEGALRTFRQNRISELHNQFALLFNRKDYEGARAAVQKALEEFPGERQLAQDLALVEKTLGRTP
ncbi:MAG: hypothetical protein LBD09_02710 [Treponema sp.]|nr:hypothetical protein [Treponema sp.]